MLGVTAFSSQMPAFLCAPLAGVLVDRWEHRRTLIATQILSALQSAALAYLALTGTISIRSIIILAICQGLVNAIDLPARQAFLMHMVERRADLPNAIALNSSVFNAARLVGPAIAGLLIAKFGEGVCFAIDAVSYLAVVAAFLLMRIEARDKPRVPATVLRELRDGFSYAFGFVPIRSLLLIVAAMSLFGLPYTVFLPVFARHVFGGGPQTLGNLTAATGIGALAGAIMLAMRPSIRGLGEVIKLAAIAFGAAVLGFSSATSLAAAMPLLAIAGFSMISLMAACNTVIQTVVDDDKRGRVMSLYGMSFMGMMPLGSVAAGYLAEPHRLGVSLTIAIGGIICAISGLIFGRKLPQIKIAARPILIKRGIIQNPTPEIGTPP